MKINWIDDYDQDIAVLHECMRDKHKELCDLVNNTIPTIEEYNTIKKSTPSDIVERAFRTLFLNRTNFSGILTSGPIGGYE